MIRVHCFGFAFTPRWIPTVFLLMALPLLISLGIWQWHRAADKHQLKRQFQARGQATLALKNIDSLSLKNLAYRSIRITGHYDNAHSLLLDNKVMHHRVGYEVLTPFIPDNVNKMVIVNRGWIAGTGRRDRLPSIAPGIGKQTITGFIQLTPKKAFVLGSKDGHFKEWPVLIQVIDKEQFAKLYQKPLYPFVILLSAKARDGFVRQWNPTVITPEKHIAYAVQWFALALTLVIIYLMLNTKRRSGNGKPRKTSRSQ